MEAGEKLAAIPAGAPVTESATAAFKLEFPAVVNLTPIPYPPAMTVALVDAGVKVNVGNTAATTRLTDEVWVTPPPVAVTVML
jgi:hypothetical protein